MCVCVFVCVCVCVCVCVMQDVAKTKNLLSLERVARGSSKSHRIRHSNAHRQYIKNLTLSGGLFREEKPCGSKCSRNENFSYVNVVKDKYHKTIPEHLPIQI